MHNTKEESMTTETQATASPRPFLTYSDAALVQLRQEMLDAAKAHEEAKERIDMELLARMNERGAKGIPDAAYDVKMEENVTYDQAAFTPLKEVFLGDDLKTVYTPEHEETVTVKEKWDTVRVKAMASKYGDAAKLIVEQARLVSGHKLSVKPKGK